MKRMKRAIALFMAVVMCFSVCPVSALAVTEPAETAATEPHPEQNTVEPTVPVVDVEEPEVPSTEPPLEVNSEEDPEEPTESEVAIVASGNCGTNVTWTLDTEGTLTISGSGEMNGYSSGSSSKPGYKYRSEVVKLVVEEGVTGIGKYAFYSYTSLKEVSLPETLKSIGNHAFYGTALERIEIPNSVTTMGNNVFYQCTALKEVSLPESLTGLGNSVL